MPRQLLIIVFFITILLLAIANFQYRPTVLGAATEKAVNPQEEYLKNLVKSSPDYFPAYIALYKITGSEEYLSIAKALNPNSSELLR